MTRNKDKDVELAWQEYKAARDYRKRGRYTDALRLYNRAITKLESSAKIADSFNRVCEYYVRVYYDYSLTLFEQNETERAGQHFKKLLHYLKIYVLLLISTIFPCVKALVP